MSNGVEIWIDLLRNVGFPIVLAAYLLLRFEKKIGELTEVIEDLKRSIQKKK